MQMKQLLGFCTLLEIIDKDGQRDRADKSQMVVQTRGSERKSVFPQINVVYLSGGGRFGLNLQWCPHMSA